MHLFNPEQALALACDEAIKRRRSASRRECIAAAAPIPVELVSAIYGRDLTCLNSDADRAAFLAVWALLQVEWADALIAELDKEK